MIVIPSKKGESVVIGDEIILTVIEVQGDVVRLQVECPRNTSVQRKEVYEMIVDQGRLTRSGPGTSSPANGVAH